MKNELFYFNYYHRKELLSISQNLLIDCSDCHYLFSIKGHDFKHRVLGLEGFVQSFQMKFLERQHSYSVRNLYELVVCIENVLNEFTCGAHRLEVKLFNSIFYHKHQLQRLLVAIQKDLELM